MQETRLTRPNMMDYYDEDDNLDYDGFQRDWNAFRDAEMAMNFTEAANREYGITAEEWKNTPQNIKNVMSRMHQDLTDFHNTIENLEDWRDSMPI